MGEVSHQITALCVITSLFLVACSGDDDACADLGAALAGADSGDIVAVGACRIDGVSVDVPAGVTVRGEGASSVLAGSDVVVRLGDGARLERVTVESSTVGGIEADGSTGVVIEDVEVRATLGFGIRITGDGAALTRVTLVGPVTEENANDVPSLPAPTDTATHGLVLNGAGSMTAPVTLNDVDVRGFGRIGALLRDVTASWTGGTVSGNLTTGIMVHGGAVTLDGVEVSGTLQGVQPIPPYGVVAAGGAVLDTDGVILSGNDGVGVLSDDADTTHSNLSALDNGDAAVWAQRSPGLTIGGSSALSGNALAGVVSFQTPTALSNLSIDGTRNATRINGEVGEVQVGDGVHLVIPDAVGLAIDGLRMTNNERAGMLFDVADGTLPAGSITGVMVDGSGGQLGAVAQGPSGLLTDGWDVGITRTGAVGGNDSALSEVLDVLGLIAPMFVPREEL